MRTTGAALLLIGKSSRSALTATASPDGRSLDVVVTDVVDAGTRARSAGMDAPAGVTEDLRSAVWGGLLKIVWYP